MKPLLRDVQIATTMNFLHHFDFVELRELWLGRRSWMLVGSDFAARMECCCCGGRFQQRQRRIGRVRNHSCEEEEEGRKRLGLGCRRRRRRRWVRWRGRCVVEFGCKRNRSTVRGWEERRRAKVRMGSWERKKRERDER